MPTPSVTTISGVQVVDIEQSLDVLTKAHIAKEQYKTWKKNAPLLYDTIINKPLQQVSLSVEWLPGVTIDEENGFETHQILMGSQSINDNPNQIIICDVKLPIEQPTNEDGTFTKPPNNGSITTTQRILHQEDVNRARYMPQNPNLIATKSSTRDVYVFNRTLHPSHPEKGALAHPQLLLSGHTDEGYGLAWHPMNEGTLVSGSNDKMILTWDINGSTSKSQKALMNSSTADTVELMPLQSFEGHTEIVEDVCFHPKTPTMILSCSDDKFICVWDTREGSRPVFKVEGHTREVNSLSINPFDNNLFLSGSTDNTVAMWDLRKLESRLHSFEHHTDQVFAVQWSPHNANIFASSGIDTPVLLWDTSRIGEEQDAEDAEDGPPELLFVHAGHTEKVNDIAWSSVRPWTLASVADNEVLQIWEPARAIREEGHEEEEQIDDADLE